MDSVPPCPLPASLLCPPTVDSAEVCLVFFLQGQFLTLFSSLSLSLSLSLLPPLPLPVGPPGLAPAGGLPAGQGRPDGGAILGLRAFGTG